jgi:hypothetical protein
MREPKPVKLFVAVLAAGDQFWRSLEVELSAVFGSIDLSSSALEWSASLYYEKEMGSGLLRKLFSFEGLRSPMALVECKHRARFLENRYREALTHQRRVNIDPGYLEAGKVVLASTKNANHRIYLNSGIYAEATLCYVGGNFLPYEYTYADYRWPETLEFFGCVRRRYLEQLRGCEGE